MVKLKPANSKNKKQTLVPTGTTEEGTNKAIVRRHSKTVEDVIEKVKTGKHCKVVSVFKMRELIEGQRKKVQEPTAMKHPNTGKLIVSSTEIKSVTLKY